MIDVNELRKGVTFEFEGNLYKVLDYSHNKTGRGNANIRIKARNMLSGATIEGELFYFMDNETFEQYPIAKEMLDEMVGFLKENMGVKITFYGTKAIDIELPLTVDLKVTWAEVAVKGDTATGQTKKVTVETGADIQTPYFINEGDIIRVDTRTGQYLTRATQ